MEKRIRFTIVLLLLLIVMIAFSFQSKGRKENLVFRESLDEKVLVVDGQSLTLRELAFYVAYEEKTIQEQAILYNPDKPRQYWNLHVDGQFVKVAAKQAVLDMAVHDEIFYEMAVAEDIRLNTEEQNYLANEQSDFWSDLEDWQREQLGISQQDLDAVMEKIALANKYQKLYAQIQNEEYESYNVGGDAYEKLLSEHESKEIEKVWDRVDFGNITLDN